MQALTVVKPSEERARVCSESGRLGPAPWGKPWWEPRGPPASPPTQPQAQATLGTQEEKGAERRKTARPAVLRVPDLAKAPLAAEAGPCS